MNWIKLAVMTGLFIVAAVPSAFASMPYKCKVEIHYGAHRADTQQRGESVQAAIIGGMQTGCTRACKDVEAASDGKSRSTCFDACIREAKFVVAYCIDHHTKDDIALADDAIEQARRALTSGTPRQTPRGEAQKPELYGSKSAATSQDSLLLTRWYGAYEQPQKQTTTRKERKTDLIEMQSPRRPLILMRPKQAPLLNLR